MKGVVDINNERILKYFTPKKFKDKTKYERKKDVWKRQIRRGNDI